MVGGTGAALDRRRHGRRDDRRFGHACWPPSAASSSAYSVMTASTCNFRHRQEQRAAAARGHVDTRRAARRRDFRRPPIERRGMGGVWDASMLLCVLILSSSPAWSTCSFARTSHRYARGRRQPADIPRWRQRGHGDHLRTGDLHHASVAFSGALMAYQGFADVQMAFDRRAGAGQRDHR